MSLDYVSAYHLHCSIKLVDGRELILRGLNQGMTYAGLLEGYPTKNNNDALIKRAVERVREGLHGSARVHLLEPKRRTHLHGPEKPLTERQRRRPPEWLPMVECVGHFTSHAPARDETRQLSALTIVWYQDEYGPPIAPETVERLRSLAWNSLAADCDF